MSSCACPASKPPVDATSSAYQAKVREIARALAHLSQSAAYYSLQVKNGHVDLLEEGLPEMQSLLNTATPREL
jgi:hypothetical protein